MSQARAILPLTIALAACSATPTVIPTKNLDRPTDVAFVCLGLVSSDSTGTTVLTGRGMEACHPRASVDPASTTNGVRTLGTFAFVPNAGRGELAVADMERGRLLDLTPEAPGYGMLPVGGDPEVVAATQDGCWVATANRTSCDITLVDPARLLIGPFSTSTAPAVPATGAGDTSRRLAVRTAGGTPLSTAIGEIAFLPPTSSSPRCQAGAAPRAVVTFPSCDMVAVVELAFDSGVANVVSAYYVRPDLPGGFQPAGSEPVCPVDCGSAAAADGGSAGPTGQGIDGGIAPAGYGLQPLVLTPDGHRVYVGSLRDTAISSLDIGPAGLANPARIELAEQPAGVSRLRLGVDPFLDQQVPQSDGTTATVAGQFLRSRGAFLYAFAGDNSIRVLDLDGATPIECDVNINVNAIAAPLQRGQSCFPIGTTPRRPLARGPGISIPTFLNSDLPPPLPRDISFAELQPYAGDANVHALSGQFGFVLASNGQVYVLNLAPNAEDATATHSFREVRDVGKTSRTPIAMSIAPQRSELQTDQAFASTATLAGNDGPLLRTFSTDSGKTTSWLDYPDPDSIVSPKWDIVWEGILPGTARGSGIVRAPAEAGLAGTLGDAGADFCASQTRVGDVLMFAGCAQDVECQPDNEFTCQVSVSGARGMCLPMDTTRSAQLIERCGRFMGSRMRYEVARATPTALDVRLKLDEVPKTTLNPCQQDSDCWPDADHGARAGGSASASGRLPFACVEVRPQDRRCVQRCSAKGKDTECRAGHVCEEVPWVVPSGDTYCVEAPPIDPGCFPQPMTAYSVRAGHAFMVVGSLLPRPHTTRVVDGVCQDDAPGDPSLVERIPLNAPRCPDAFLNLTNPTPDAQGNPVPSPTPFVQNLAAQAGLNPCLYQGARSDGETSQAAEAGAPGDHVRAFFQNPQIRFVMTNLEDYAGDLLAIHFELQYGFVPLTVKVPSYEVLLTMGTRIVTGPTKTPESPILHSPPTGDMSYPYLYVVDQGRTALTPGSRGQVLRINPRAGSSEVVSFDTTYSGSTPFQLQ
jgi:hypothetical protein